MQAKENEPIESDRNQPSSEPKKISNGSPTMTPQSNAEDSRRQKLMTIQLTLVEQFYRMTLQIYRLRLRLRESKTRQSETTTSHAVEAIGNDSERLDETKR